MATLLIILCLLHHLVSSLADIAKDDVQFLNELPLDKLLRLKTSLQQLVTSVSSELDNVTTTTPTYQNFGAQAMAVHAPPIKRGDYEEVPWHKSGSSSKISNIFSMSVTTLAFLAFGGYLLCLIVHAVRKKQMFINPAAVPSPPSTFVLSAGIKKRPQPQFASYGRRRRENREERSLRIDIPPEQLYSALLQLCEGYAKWSEKYSKDNDRFSH